MKYTEITFTITPDSETARDLVSALSGDCGVDSLEERDDHLIGYVATDCFDPVGLQSVLDDFPMPDVKVTFSAQQLEDHNWNEVWEAHGFDPIDVDGRCIIYDAKRGLPGHDPSVSSDAASPDAVSRDEAPLYVGIEAVQAFGSGTHETTQMIVSSLLDMPLKGKRVLDCGCGTGILGIVAAKLGAREVVGYDLDDWSVRNAQHNGEINGVEMEIFEGDKQVLSHVSGLFDLILANINRNVLLADMDSFVEVLAHDGSLILSGFYEMDIPLLEEAATRQGLVVSRVSARGDWRCLLLQRPSAQG